MKTKMYHLLLQRDRFFVFGFFFLSVLFFISIQKHMGTPYFRIICAERAQFNWRLFSVLSYYFGFSIWFFSFLFALSNLLMDSTSVSWEKRPLIFCPLKFQMHRSDQAKWYKFSCKYPATRRNFHHWDHFICKHYQRDSRLIS